MSRPRPNLTAEQLNALSDRDYIAVLWGEDILEVDRQTTRPMTMDEFMSHCVCCGGNWGAMFLSGIKKLYPEVYDAVPENLGFLAWNCVCILCTLLNITE